MPAPFDLPYFQHGLIQVALLAVGCGLLGTWIVLRGLAFFSHAVAAASFPGLVLAAGLGFSPVLGAFAVGGVFAATVGQLAARDHRASYDTLTALALVAALAAGVVLASDVYHSTAQVDALLFGSLLLVDPIDQYVAAASAVLALAATWALGPRWLATGFDPSAARSLGVRSGWTDLALLALVALAAVSALAAVGALLAGALLVVPAATTRLWTSQLRTWQIASVALAAGEGIFGLWLSVQLNAPPGATLAVVSGVVFALTPAIRAIPRLRPALPALAALLLLGGCGGTSDKRPVVVASTTQIGDWARAVGGNDVRVEQILKPNTDPHEYEPRPDDVQAVHDARVVLVNGDGLDSWMEKLRSDAGGSATVVNLGAVARTQLPGESSGAEASPVDPHWWHDPHNAEAAVERIRSALGAAIPAHRLAFDRRAASYVNQIDALDQAIAGCFVSVPRTERKLVTSHDAFNYFANRYGIQVVGAIIPSQSSEAQPSAGDVARLVDQVKREHVHAIFLETSENAKLARAVAQQTGAIGNLELYGDTLGAAGSKGATYLGMERANADAMMRGFTSGKRGCP